MDFHEAAQYWIEGDLYLIPINLLNEHWVLVTVDCLNRTMAYYDSLGAHRGWDGAIFLRTIFRFMQQYVVKYGDTEKYADHDMNAEHWTFISSKDIWNWSAKLNRFIKIPQKNGYDCGLFTLKFAELFIQHPENRISLQTLIKKEMPNRSLYKKHFLGLYVEYCRLVAEQNESPRKRKKRHREESWGAVAESSFKRVPGDRDKADIMLRQSTETLARVQMTTPTKRNRTPEKLSDNDSDDDVKDIRSDKLVVEAMFESPRSVNPSDSAEVGVEEETECKEKMHISSTSPDEKPDISVIAKDTLEINDEHLFDSSEDEISEITDSTKQNVTKTQIVNDVKSTNPHVLANIPHSYKHVVDLNKYNEANFNRLIDDYKLAHENLKVFFQLPLRDLLHDPPASIRADLLKLHYRHEDFREYVHKQIEDELSKHRKLLKNSKFYTPFDGSKFEFDQLAMKIRKELKEGLGGKFPHDRDVKTYPIITFTDVMRDMPVENTTILESPPPGITTMLESTSRNAGLISTRTEEEYTDATNLSTKAVTELTTEGVTLSQESVTMEIEETSSLVRVMKSENKSFFTDRMPEELLHFKMQDLTEMQDDEVTCIGVKLIDYKKRYINSKQNQRLCELVITSHETNTPAEADTANFRLIGFPNLGNTCFINSVLQCFFRISYVQKMMQNYVPQDTVTPNLMTLLYNLYHAINKQQSFVEHLKLIINVSKCKYILRTSVLQKMYSTVLQKYHAYGSRIWATRCS